MVEALDLLEIDEELDQRIAVLRRYRRMLELQRSRLQDYLALIDSREAAVREGDVERLERYAAAEQDVIRGIMAVQTCLDPLAAMYRQAAPEGSPDIDELHERLEKLRTRIVTRNTESVSLLKGQMEQLRTEIAGLRLPRGARAVYAAAPEPRYVDVLG